MSMVRFRLTKPSKLRDFPFKVSYIYLFTYPILTATFYLFSTTHPLLSACLTSTVVYLNLFTLTCPCFLPEFKAKARGRIQGQSQRPTYNKKEGSSEGRVRGQYLSGMDIYEMSCHRCEYTENNFIWQSYCIKLICSLSNFLCICTKLSKCLQNKDSF